MTVARPLLTNASAMLLQERSVGGLNTGLGERRGPSVPAPTIAGPRASHQTLAPKGVRPAGGWETPTPFHAAGQGKVLGATGHN